MIRYQAFAQNNWREDGLARLVVTRTREDGSVDFGVFLIDIWCLGVKDAFGDANVTEQDVRDLLDAQLPAGEREPIHPACAKKLIEGAIAYAEQLGFSPHRDFRKARKVLSSLDGALCPTEFIYGCEGRPCYVPGPDDSEKQIDRVLAILEARLGPDGFDFEDPAGDEDGARELFMDWLDAQPGEGARFYEMSGMMTGLLAAPVSIAPLSIIEAMWGPKGPTWADREEAQAFLDLFMGYWNYIAGRVLDTIAQDAPAEEHPVDIRPEELPEGNGLAVAAASVDWAQGFLRTTARWPEAWGDALQRPDLAPHWEVIRWWADLAKPGNLARVQAAAEGAEQRTLAKAVSALVRALRGGKGLSDQHETR